MPGRTPTLAWRFGLDKAAEPMDVYDLRAPRPRGALPLKSIYTYLIHTGSPLSFRKDRHNIRALCVRIRTFFVRRRTRTGG